MRLFSDWRRLIGCALLLLAAGMAQAQVPPTQSANGIDFVMGGIGTDESQAILSEGKWWPLTIDFSEHTADGDGPLLLVNLPPGAYTIAAQHKASIKVQKFQVVKGESRRISIHW